MSDYSFRIRFIMPSTEQINVGSMELEIQDVWPFGVRLVSGDTDRTIKNASNLLLRAGGFSTEAEALAAAEACRDSLIVCLANLKIGVDFGDRAPKSGFFRSGLEWLKNKLGNRVLDDQLGIMTFESDPPPVFARLGSAKAIRGRPQDNLLNSVNKFAQPASFLTDQELLAYDLFSASYFQASQDARLILLIMSIESLVSPLPRSQAAVRHVEDLIDCTKRSEAISEFERESILGSLQWLKSESIRQAARRFVNEILTDQEYMEMPAERFITHAYDLRSRLVHGMEPFPSRNEVGQVAASLETLVGDLMSVPYIQSTS